MNDQEQNNATPEFRIFGMETNISQIAGGYKYLIGLSLCSDNTNTGRSMLFSFLAFDNTGGMTDQQI